MWFLRAWKISELEKQAVVKQRREQDIRDTNAPPLERPGITRHISRSASVESKVKVATGLCSWQRV